MPNRKNTREDFHKCYEINQQSGCWIWQRCLDLDGYGKFRYDGKYWRAHRLSYFLKWGAIRNDLTIDHLCRNRACVNPDHMEQVPNSENVLRGESPFVQNKRKTHCKYGHEFTKDNTYIAKNGTRKCKACMSKAALDYYHKHKDKINPTRNEKRRVQRALKRER